MKNRTKFLNTFIFSCMLFLMFSCTTTKNNELSETNQESIKQNKESPKKSNNKINPSSLTKAPKKNCDYDINLYFDELEQYNVSLKKTKNWYKQSSSQGVKSTNVIIFNSILDKFANVYGNTGSTPDNILPIFRMQIGPYWVHSENAYEIEWKRGKGIEITRLSPEKSKAMYYLEKTFSHQTLRCEK